MIRPRTLPFGGLVFGLFVGQILSGCGGATPEVKTPDTAAPAAATEAAQEAKPDTGIAPTRVDDAMAQEAKEAYDRGWKSWGQGELEAAKTAFTEAVQKAPLAASTHYALATVLERLGNAAGAQQEYRAAFTQRPDYDLAVGGYALSLARNGHLAEADSFLTARRNASPKSARMATYLAEVKSLAQDSGSAQQLAQDALRLDPELKEAMVVIARDHFRAHRIGLAQYALQAILEGFGDATPPRDRDNPEARLLRGLIAKEAGRRVAAMTDFDATRAKRPDIYEATLNLGVMKLEAGNGKEALPLLESAVRYAPMDPLTHLGLGDCYRLVGNSSKAKFELERALQLDSRLLTAHYNLGLLYLFSPPLAGTLASDQVGMAISELEKYKAMRGSHAPTGVNDDIDELINRAKAKQLELKNAAAAAAQSAAAPPPPPPAGAKKP